MTLLCVKDTDSVSAAVHADDYWLAGVDQPPYNQFCVNTGLHASTAFDLTDYDADPCGGDGNFDDLVVLRTTGYSSGGNATLRAVMHDGEYLDNCDYVKGYLHSAGDGYPLRGLVRYLHARYPGQPGGFYGNLDIPATPGGSAFGWGIGRLTTDNDGCPWSGYHAHQDFPPGESSGNMCVTALGSIVERADPYDIWSTTVQKVSYNEGVPC